MEYALKGAQLNHNHQQIRSVQIVPFSWVWVSGYSLVPALTMYTHWSAVTGLQHGWTFCGYIICEPHY